MDTGGNPAIPLLGLVATLIWATGSVAGDISQGKQQFAKHCAVCHTVVPEFHKEGPSLAGVYGRKAGTAPFFANYTGLKNASFVWDDRTLEQWLVDPRSLTGGKNTAMNFRLEDAAARADIIAYLRTLK